MQIPVHSTSDITSGTTHAILVHSNSDITSGSTHAKFLSTQPVTLPQDPHMQILVHSTSDITSGSTHAFFFFFITYYLMHAGIDAHSDLFHRNILAIQLAVTQSRFKQYQVIQTMFKCDHANLLRHCMTTATMSNITCTNHT